MKKCIEAYKVQEIIDNCDPINDSLENLIDTAQTMVSADKMQKLITKYDVNGNSFYLIAELRKLINPKPKLYGGLTIEDWGKLSNLFHVMVSGYLDSGIHNYYLNDFIKRKGIDATICLLPDQENHIRYFSCSLFNNAPIPDKIEIELHSLNSTKKYKSYGGSVNWCKFNKYFSGYRIVGVKGE